MKNVQRGSIYGVPNKSTTKVVIVSYTRLELGFVEEITGRGDSGLAVFYIFVGWLRALVGRTIIAEGVGLQTMRRYNMGENKSITEEGPFTERGRHLRPRKVALPHGLQRGLQTSI